MIVFNLYRPCNYVLFIIHTLRLTHQRLNLPLIIRLKPVRIHSHKHASVKLMLAIRHSRQLNLRVQHVLAVAAPGHPIIYVHVDDVLFTAGHFAISKVLCQLIRPHAIPIDPICWLAPVRANMADFPLRPLVVTVVLCGQGQMIRPLKSGQHLLCLQRLHRTVPGPFSFHGLLEVAVGQFAVPAVSSKAVNLVLDFLYEATRV